MVSRSPSVRIGTEASIGPEIQLSTFEKKQDGLVARLDTNLNVELAPDARGTIVIEYSDDALVKAFADVRDETIVTVCVHFVEFGEGQQAIFSSKDE